MSLGVDLVPHKVCSLDCLYCEVGKTTRLTLERKEYIPVEKIRQEFIHYIANHPDPDYITFSGSGEPTLNSKMGEMIRFIKEQKPEVPVAVLTNGTMLFDQEVRKTLMDADLVLPSLDAATQDIFEKINRPANGLTIDLFLQGMIDFCREFKGKVWLEVFILPGCNDHAEELAAMRKAIMQINPDAIQLNTLDRPGTEQGLRAATKAELQRVSALLQLDNVEIITAAHTRKDKKPYRKDIESVILETLSRRPCTLDDLSSMLDLHALEINKYLDVLEAEGLIEHVIQDRGVFYHARRLSID